MVVEVVSKGSCNFVEVRGEREGSARAMQSVERGGRKLVGDVLQVSGAELGLSVHVSNKVKSLVSGLLGPPSWLAGP